MTDKRHPKEKSTTGYKTSPHFSITDDLWNDVVGAYRVASRSIQWMEASSGQLPEEGDSIKIEFEDGAFHAYTVARVLTDSAVMFKDKDKYKFECRKADSSIPDEYPDKVVVGARTGSYVR